MFEENHLAQCSSEFTQKEMEKLPGDDVEIKNNLKKKKTRCAHFHQNQH